MKPGQINGCWGLVTEPSEVFPVIPNTLFHWLTINERGRDFVVGDIHGHAALLDCLLDRVRFDPASDRLFALGDLIDRGPQSQLLLARVRDEP